MDGLSGVRGKLEEIRALSSLPGRKPDVVNRLAHEAIALLDGEQGKRITGFVREIGSNRQLFRFHVRQSNPKEIPYEGPMDAAILILGTESEGT